MSGYIKYFDEAPRWLRVVCSIFWVFMFLYRLFKVIIDRAEDTSKLIYVILNVVPFVGQVIAVFDIVKTAMDHNIPTNFADMCDFSQQQKRGKVVDAQ